MAQLKIRIIVDDQGNVKLKGVKGSVDNINKSLTTLATTANMVKGAMIGVFGGLSLYTMINFGKEALQAADTIGKLADNINISTKTLQEFQYAARLSGVETSLLNKSLEQFVKRVGELRAGTGDLEYKLKDMNQELMSQLKHTGNTTDALNLMMKALANTDNAMDRAALAAAAFGRSGVKMVNIVKDGYEEFEKLKQEINDLGGVMRDDLIRNAEEINNKFATMHTIIKTQLTEAVVELAPAILKLSEALASLALNLGDFVREMRELSKYERLLTILLPAAGFLAGGIPGAIGGAHLANMMAPKSIADQEYEMKQLQALTMGKTYGDIKGWAGTYEGPKPLIRPAVNIPEIDQEWKKWTNDAAKDLTNSLVSGTKDFLEQFRLLMASQFAQQFIQPLISQAMAGLFKPGTGLLMGSAFGLGGASYANILGAGAIGYGLGGAGGGIGAAGGALAGSIIPGIGTLAGAIGGGLLGGIIGGEGIFGREKEDPYKVLKEMKTQYFSEMRSTLANAISEGFRAGAKSEGYKSFIDSLNQSMAGIVEDVFMEAFVAQTIKPLMGLFEPVFTQINALMYSTTADFEKKVDKLVGQLKFMDIYKQIGLKENEIRAYAIEQLKGKYGIPSGIGEIAGAFPERGEIEFFFEQYQPYFEEVSSAMNSVKEALGLNTNALLENTDALIGPVESFLRDLTVGALAPAVSREGMQTEYNKLLQQAIQNPEAFSTFAGFARSDYLPFMQMYPDYAQQIEGIKGDVSSLPWYQQAQTNVNVNVKVELDGQEFKSRICKVIQTDPDVRNEIARVRA